MPSPTTIGDRSAAVLLVLLLALSLVVATPPTAAEAARGRTADEAAAEATLLAHHNGARGGLGALQRSGDLDAVARSWADTMAASGTLSHNPNYSSQISNWSRVAENVGMSRDPSATAVQLAGRIAERYMASSGHRANILTAEFTQVGIGMTVGAEGSLWSVVVFRAPASGGTTSSSGGSASADSGSAAPGRTGANSAGSTGTTSAGSGAGGGAASPAVDAEAQARAAEAQRQREAERARVRDAQEALAGLGWYDGEVDGLLGPITAAAVGAFQAAVGLVSNGTLDEPTLAALGDEDAITRSDHEAAEARAARTAARYAAQAERLQAWLLAHTVAAAGVQPAAAQPGPDRTAPAQPTVLPDHLVPRGEPLVLSDGEATLDRLTSWVRRMFNDVVGL